LSPLLDPVEFSGYPECPWCVLDPGPGAAVHAAEQDTTQQARTGRARCFSAPSTSDATGSSHAYCACTTSTKCACTPGAFCAATSVTQLLRREFLRACEFSSQLSYISRSLFTKSSNGSYNPPSQISSALRDATSFPEARCRTCSLSAKYQFAVQPWKPYLCSSGHCFALKVVL
jgi:hypothetical protein